MHPTLPVLAVLLAAALAPLAACGDSGAATSLTPCDPLAASEQPITLGEIVAIGRDAAGTIYLVDRVPGGSDNRLFISDGDMLYRQRVSGGGSGQTQDGEFVSLTIPDAEAPFVVVVEITNGETAMAVVPDGNDGGKIMNVGTAGETLEILDESAIDGMTVRNLPGEIEVEYIAEVDNGKMIVVTRPRDDWTYEDFRLFYGEPEAMTEQEVIEVLRRKDGGSTTITFTLDGAEAVLDLPVVSHTEADGTLVIEPGPGTLRVGEDEYDVTQVPDRDISAYEFSCLDA